MQPQPISLRLYDDEIKRLEEIARKTGSLAATGKNAGNPSWRTLIKRIANNELEVTMSANAQVAQRNAGAIIAQLRQEPGFVSAEMVDWRESGGYVEPKISLESEGGIFEAWVNEGESVQDMNWQEA